MNIYPKCYYRTSEVVHHIKYDDFWIILNQRVLDLSSLMKTIDQVQNNEKDLTVCIASSFYTQLL